MPKRDEAPIVHVTPKWDENKTMKSVQWMGSKDMRVVEAHKPLITDSGDAIIKVTSAAICGSDLHLYLGAMPGKVLKNHFTSRLFLRALSCQGVRPNFLFLKIGPI